MFSARDHEKVLLSTMVLLSMCAALLRPMRKQGCGAGDAAAQVLNDIQGAPTKDPAGSVGVGRSAFAMVPSMLKGGYCGREVWAGLASCRTPKGWSAPGFFVFNGRSVGFQIGGQAVDLVMLIMK